MSDTPRTDALEHELFDDAMARRIHPKPVQEPTERYAILCRELERGLDEQTFQAKKGWNAAHEMREALEKAERELAAYKEDAERLQILAEEPFCDEYGGVDLHEKATEFADGEPHKEHYLAALRFAIDAAKEGK